MNEPTGPRVCHDGACKDHRREVLSGFHMIFITYFVN